MLTGTFRGGTMPRPKCLTPPPLAGAGGGAGGGSVVNNYSYNLTVNSAANTEPILADFATLRSMNTRSS